MFQKNRNVIFSVVAILLVMSVSAFAAVDPAGAFGAKFVDLYKTNIAKLIVFGVTLLAAYEFWKTKQFTFLIIGILIVVIVLSAPSIAMNANDEWKMDANQTATWSV